MGTTYADAEHALSGQVVRLRVLGMDCGSCVAKVEAAASRLPGIRDVSANLMAETLTARLVSGSADTEALAAAVSALGYIIALSRATLADIRQNVGTVMGLKLVFLVTTLLGITGLWPAILADTGATVVVTPNALRLLRWRPAAAGAVS